MDVRIEDIRDIIEKVTKEEVVIKDDKEILDIDSLSFIKIVVEIEEVYNIEIPDECLVISQMNSIEKIVNILMKI